jgi:thioredoxin reductase
LTWALLLLLVGGLGLALFTTLSRRSDLRRMRDSLDEHQRAVRSETPDSRLQFPVVDLSRCLGCATCVAVCPEDDVLSIVHGQAMVVNPGRCVGVSACERECPVGAVTVTIANLDSRTDVPVVDDRLEAVGADGLFLAGEVTAHALIKTAIEHGAAVAREVAHRTRAGAGDDDVLDLCIVGAGPAGLACALEAKRHGLRFIGLDQEERIGGTVAKYPRRKLVLTEPVDLPLHGRLSRTTYTKEELIELWEQVAAEHELPFVHGAIFEGLTRDADDGTFTVHAGDHTRRARHVCLALGRRGVPRRLDVPGEELPKVAYSLLDAQSYRNRRILVIGGGDSAVEAAVGLAEQPGNRVTLSYRREGFHRVRSKNERRLEASVAGGKLHVVFRSEVRSIRPDTVELAVGNGQAANTGYLPNDDVFVMAGGIPPFELLERSGVSFDPSLRPPPAPIAERGTGLANALAAGFALALGALLWALWNVDYYGLPGWERPVHEKHPWLRPGLGLGLWFGIAAALLVVVNLLYLLRRSPRVRFDFGSLQAWMTSHVATGILAFLCAMLHGAMAPRDSVGGHAFWALAVLLVTGGIGRYFYAYVPRAANGRELELTEVRAELDRMAAEGADDEYGKRAQKEVTALIEARQWSGTFVGRVLALAGVQFDLRRVLKRLEEEGRAAGIDPERIHETRWLARRAHRTALMAAHYEDLRGILGTWRWLHRWVAALLVLLVVVHIAHALVYGVF